MNTDPAIRQAPVNLDDESQLVLTLIERILLDKPVPIPLPQILRENPSRTDLDQVMYYHAMIGHGRSNAERLREREAHQDEPETSEHETYASEEEEILALFSLQPMIDRVDVTSTIERSRQQKRELPQDIYQMAQQHQELLQYMQQLAQWRQNSPLTHEILFRYMVVGLHPLITALMTTNSQQFPLGIAKYRGISVTHQRQFELFEQYYGKSLDSREEYAALYTGVAFSDVRGEDLFRFVVEGIKFPVHRHLLCKYDLPLCPRL